MDFLSFVSECMVRALDYRLRLHSATDEEAVEAIDARVDELTGGGLTLVRPLFDGLAAFEQGDQDFAEYIPTLFADVPELTAQAGDPGDRRSSRSGHN